MTSPINPEQQNIETLQSVNRTYRPGALYRTFRSISYDHSYEPCITDEKEHYTYAQLEALVEDKITALAILRTPAFYTPNFNPEDNQKAAKPCALIYLPKSAELVAWQLALNAHNIAFLTLEYGSAPRLEQAIKECQPKYVITPAFSEKLLGEASEICRMSNIQSNIEYFKNYALYPSHCDYLVFSSGSTGKPKKILLEAAPVVEVVRAQASLMGLQKKCVAMWLLNSAFDASLSDIYSAIFSGAHLIISNEKPSQIKKISALIEKHNVSHVDVPPVVFSVWLKDMEKYPHKYKSLRHIIFGGEKANAGVVQELLKYVSLYNAYGPTETTVCSSICIVDKEWIAEDIGYPLPGVFYKVVDGELHIGGSHVALGYDNPKLNHKFYTDDAGVRWFASGDAVEYTNHKYLYKGRLDRQFKYNGQLIYPEEIEAVALSSGASHAKIEYNQAQHKITLHYAGDLDKVMLANKLPSWMCPHLYSHIENVETSLNANWKLVVPKKSILS